MKTMTAFFAVTLLLVTCGVSAAQASQYDLKEMTPAVKQAIEGRQGRYDKLQSLKSSGAVGENNRGYVEAFRAGEPADVAAAENTDRRVIYQAIAQQNNLGSEGIPVIEQVFAQVQREKANAGDKIQTPSGAWSNK